MTLLELRALSKSYPDGWQLSGVSLKVDEREIVTLLGPSGCGKTTLLRLVAGLEMPDEGQILVAGREVTRTPPHERGFGLMFQDYALFPHRDVFGNVAFGLQIRGVARPAVAARVAEVLALVGLTGYERRDVNQLSGGERQRVALARCLAPSPRLVMLDEPLGALDRALRERLMVDLPAILHQAGVTAITVTHDQEEAFALAHRVVVMRDGGVVQVGTPRQVYYRPASPWVAHFLGLTNLLPVLDVEEDWVDTPIGRFQPAGAHGDGLPDGGVRLLIRPEAARVGGQGPNVVQGVIAGQSFRGGYCRLNVRYADGTRLVFHLPAGIVLPGVGQPISLSLDPEAMLILESGFLAT